MAAAAPGIRRFLTLGGSEHIDLHLVLSFDGAASPRFGESSRAAVAFFCRRRMRRRSSLRNLERAA
jgi:hypothetical protein